MYVYSQTVIHRWNTVTDKKKENYIKRKADQKKHQVLRNRIYEATLSNYRVFQDDSDEDSDDNIPLFPSSTTSTSPSGQQQQQGDIAPKEPQPLKKKKVKTKKIHRYLRD